ncbi:MAG: DUF2264 domain-containing protein, partial [Treponema sp.]|nr:DUF2264 domain-containing protein [Treponema sp.]
CPDLENVLSVLRQGVDPASPGYWGEPGDRDQRLVEMAAIGLSLILARESFWDPLDGKEKERLYNWLSFIERRELPPSNWHFFRILVCLAFRELGLPVNEKAERESLDLMEACYLGDGWYEDGKGGSFDLYNPWGFHFYGLLYAKLAGLRDPERAGRFLDRARIFTPRFAAWFREDGSAAAFGRSLTYRYAAASLFSACAFADQEILPWGALKGLVLRNLRWWFSRPILNPGGTLSVGYGYPNQIMGDVYNSPGSPYWAFKIYLVLALGEDHPFWRAEETALAPEPRILSEKVPGFVISRGKEDTQLLSAGSYPNFDMAHAAEKYGKFAYSARFGFCVSHSSYNITMTGCDSALMLSEGDGYWRQRRQTRGRSAGPNWTASSWTPWPDVNIRTVLVSLGDWHLRFHRIESGRALQAVEGGFSLRRYRSLREPGADTAAEESRFREEPAIENSSPSPGGSLAALPWGASRIEALEPDSSRTGGMVIPAPNLNILEPQVLIPVLEGALEPGKTLWICAVRAGDRGPVCREKTPRVVMKGDTAEVYDGEGNIWPEIPV